MTRRRQKSTIVEDILNSSTNRLDQEYKFEMHQFIVREFDFLSMCNYDVFTGGKSSNNTIKLI